MHARDFPSDHKTPLTSSERAEFARFIAAQLRASRNADDPVTASQHLRGRPGIDEKTKREVIVQLFPKKARPGRPSKPKPPSLQEIIVNMLVEDDALALSPAELDIWFRAHTTMTSDARSIIVEMRRRNLI